MAGLMLVTMGTLGGCVSPTQRAEVPEVTKESEAPPERVEPPAQQEVVVGTAKDAKGGAVVVPDGEEPIYLPGIDSWPKELLDQRVEVLGAPGRMKLIPSPAVADDGAVSAGAEGDQRVLFPAPRWRSGIARLVVVGGIARDARAGPVVATSDGPVYVYEVGEKWPESLAGKPVVAVGDLLRNKRLSTPENDDSELGGRTELNEEWALRQARWGLDRRAP